MNRLFCALICVAVICGAATGRIGEVGTAAFSGASEAVSLSVSLLGAMCLWCGLMKIVERSGLSEKFCNLLMPLLKRLFPDVPQKSPAMRALSMNIAAEIMGLSNAATPLGLKAMEELDVLNRHKKTASRAMCMLVVLNTASIQLIPGNLIAMRMNYGSAHPLEIVSPMWFASFLAAAVGIGAAKLMEKFTGNGA